MTFFCWPSSVVHIHSMRNSINTTITINKESCYLSRTQPPLSLIWGSVTAPGLLCCVYLCSVPRVSLHPTRVPFINVIKLGHVWCSEHHNGSLFHWEVKVKALIMTNRDLNDLCHPHMNSNQVTVAFHHLGLCTLEIHCIIHGIVCAACSLREQTTFQPLQWFP